MLWALNAKAPRRQDANQNPFAQVFAQRTQRKGFAENAQFFEIAQRQEEKTAPDKTVN